MKKIATILVGVMVLCLIGGCATNKKPESEETAELVKNEVKETAEVEEEPEVVVEEETEPVEEPEVDVAEPEKEVAVSENSTDDESFVEIDISEDGLVNGKEFPIISEEAVNMDHSDDYGVYSTSCFDLDQFLDENGEIPEDWNWESKEGNEYSGRFAYPKLTPCRFFTDLEMSGRTDREVWYSCRDSETDTHITMFIDSGLGKYHDSQSYVGLVYENPEIPVTEVMFTANTGEGETEVLSERSVSYVTWEGSEEKDEFVTYSYYFNIGNFSVIIFWNSQEPLTQDDVQLIIDNINLTTGLER